MAGAAQPQERQGRWRTTPLIAVTSVFAQLDSESEELLKCGVKLFWVQQELAILMVSFHIWLCVLLQQQGGR